jgi:hypothetical protein
MHRGKHWRAPTYTVSHTPRHARLNTTSTPARDHEQHGCHVQRPPHPARRRGADACSRLWQQSRILFLALARVSAHHVSCLSRHVKIRDHVSQLPRNTIVSCILVSITAPVRCAQNAALLRRQTPYLRYSQHDPVHSHYAVMINTSSAFNPPTILKPSPYQRFR